MKSTSLLNFPTISQECDPPLHIHTDDLFGIFIRSYEEKENVIPSEANFHLALEFSFQPLREHFAFSIY